MRIAGYAAVFDVHDRDGDIIRRGAFGAVDFAKVPFLWEHDSRRAAGVIEAAQEDEHGLWIKARLIGAVLAQDVVRIGHGLSFGFRATHCVKGAQRELITVQLVEVSLVEWPLQPLARVNWVQS